MSYLLTKNLKDFGFYYFGISLLKYFYTSEKNSCENMFCQITRQKIFVSINMFCQILTILNGKLKVKETETNFQLKCFALKTGLHLDE